MHQNGSLGFDEMTHWVGTRAASLFTSCAQPGYH